MSSAHSVRLEPATTLSAAWAAAFGERQTEPGVWAAGSRLVAGVARGRHAKRTPTPQGLPNEIQSHQLYREINDSLSVPGAQSGSGAEEVARRRRRSSLRANLVD